MTAPFYNGAAARMHSLEPMGGFGVILARPPAEPSLKSVLGPGLLSAIVEHNRGTTWPDRDGQNLVSTILEGGGVAVLSFVDLRDAMACMLRLRREGVT